MAKHVLLTREKAKNQPWADILREAGFQVSEVPMIETVAKEMSCEADDYDWIIFTSANTVDYFLRTNELSPNIHIATIGAKTTEALQKRNFTAHFQPSAYTTDVFIEEWLDLKLQNQKILLPKSNKSRNEIAQQLTKKGHAVTEIISYETKLPNEAKQMLSRASKEYPIDIAIFASPSAWHHFLACYTRTISEIEIASIGPVTTQAIHDSGYDVFYEAEVYTMQSLCEQLIRRN
ncbi:uroporphyrinogen-III synthase [Listeria booriae]|uniref:Uroporphyrinogen-III synthase n=1 Tax=Listeria booriae TaxID=1552123 RepID=A0A842ATJ7_9LIST|nr:uroporphyrinogen-III synthase [Listeria booriae]MBC1292071.1 uroporphyrinogen-III synthase [Listeria booriae]MBC1402279.1 uroporphyrinogen-III synthase [Listeria booriae]MBC1617376.1 uroporphyrinogen-III synthase [Listeria booriae]MBC1650121.1 uroporphyrinogen-III synthase [Listeria booriae]MBC2674756.1 uroporphyrinogen-III synthase [Listeria booriae]